MQTTNIRRFDRGDVLQSNYRLLSEPVQLTYKHQPVLDGPDEQSWELEGGAVAPPPLEMTVEEMFQQQMRVRGARHQRSAKAMVPRESIRVVNQGAPAIKEVVGVRLAGGSAQDEKVAELEARIKELMAVARAPIVAAECKTESIKKFEVLFNGLRTRV